MEIALRNFLRVRRACVDPRSFGLPRRAGRRTSGLSRDDMAELLDVSPLWYGLFESGRSTRRFSHHFLERVARVLRMDDADREAFFGIVIANGNATPDVELAWGRRCWSSLRAVAVDATHRLETLADREHAVEVARTTLNALIAIGDSWSWTTHS